jgi:hypothetical protein
VNTIAIPVPLARLIVVAEEILRLSVGRVVLDLRKGSLVNA